MHCTISSVKYYFHFNFNSFISFYYSFLLIASFSITSFSLIVSISDVIIEIDWRCYLFIIPSLLSFRVLLVALRIFVLFGVSKFFFLLFYFDEFNFYYKLIVFILLLEEGIWLFFNWISKSFIAFSIKLSYLIYFSLTKFISSQI